MIIRNYKDVKAVEAEEGAAGVSIRWVITEEEGATNFVMRVFEVSPGGYSPFHRHAWEHEVFVLNGRGIVLGEPDEHEIKSGDVIFIPGGEEHQFKNTGERPLEFLCLIPTEKACNPQG